MGDPVLYEFEFNIRKELIDKLLLLDSYSEKWDFKNLENRVANNGDDAGVKSCHFMHHSLVIEKVSDEESKLSVKVFKVVSEPDVRDNHCQTRRIETRNERLQTHSQTFASCRVQTEPDVQNRRTQTQTATWTTVEAQTVESRLESADKECESEFNLGTQMHKNVMVAPRVAESQCQAVVEVVDGGCDVARLGVQVEIQTEPNVLSSFVQTDVKEFLDVPCQTLCSSVEAGMQAVAETIEQTSQVEYCWSENESQTDASIFSLRDSEAQATTHIETSTTQTEVSVVESTTETDFNMSTQNAAGAQASVELSDCSLQTDAADEVDSSCLTDHNMSTQESKDVQTAPEVVLLNEMLDTSASIDQGDSFLDRSHNLGDASTYSDLPVSKCVGVSQTDPVTIIIGDANFLVQKLKSSAMSASKVTTSGNEIEIELSADAVDRAPEEREKSFPRAKVPPVEIKPALPEAVHSQKVLPQHVGRVRMRMPVSMTLPQAPAAVRGARPAIQARAPNPSSVVSSQKQSKPSGGLYSCPFCSLCFIESPALYEHLGEAHQSDLKSKWKKSQGREGKTIIPKSSQQATQKPGPNVSKVGRIDLNNSGMDSDSTAGGRPGVKRKSTHSNVPFKYRKVDDEDDDDDDDEDYEEEEEEEEYTRPRSIRGKKRN